MENSDISLYRPREATHLLQDGLDALPVVVLSGLRQSGKSTLLTEDPLFSNRPYLTLDDFSTLNQANTAPESLLAGSKVPITIDEVQRCPSLLTAIKAHIDKKRQRGRFLLSGSANLALLAGVSESLAGRALYLTLHPMTRREIRRETHKPPALAALIEHGRLPEGIAEPIARQEVLLGGMPPVCLGPRRAAPLWFRAYVQLYVERDVRQLSQIADLIAFRILAELTALRTAQILNLSDLARDAKLSAATATRYLQLLEASFLVHRLPPFLRNRSSRLIKSPKLYFTDSGLAAHMMGVQDTKLSGSLLETWLLQNLSAIVEAHVPGARISYWSEQGRHEVDFVVEHKNTVIAIECKSGTRWESSDLAGLRAFQSRTPQCKIAILAYNGERPAALGNGLYAVPIGLLVS